MRVSQAMPAYICKLSPAGTAENHPTMQLGYKLQRTQDCVLGYRQTELSKLAGKLVGRTRESADSMEERLAKVESGCLFRDPVKIRLLTASYTLPPNNKS